MRTSKILIASAGVALLLWSCDVKDPIYETEHPNHGKVTLTVDWSGIGAGIAKPANYNISVAEYSSMLAGDQNLLDHLFTPGTYAALAWNVAQNITIRGKTATVANSTTTKEAVSPIIHHAPGWLFTAQLKNMVIEKDKHHNFKVAMKQEVRELTLMIEPTGGTVDRIASISGHLSGVAGTLDMESGTHGAPSYVDLNFIKGDDGKFRATVRILGVVGSEQIMTAKVLFNDGGPSDQPFESNMSSTLANFNSDKKTPLTLKATVETTSESGFEASITDWIVVTGGPAIAD